MQGLCSKMVGTPATLCSAPLAITSPTADVHIAASPLLEPKGCTSSLIANGATLAGMGYAAAAVCIGELVGKRLTPSRPLVSRCERESICEALARREREVFGLAQLTRVMKPEDIEFIIDAPGRLCSTRGTCVGASESPVQPTTHHLTSHAVR